MGSFFSCTTLSILWVAHEGFFTLALMAMVQVSMVLRTTAGLGGPGFLGSLPDLEFSDAPEDSLLQNI